ncbi:DUF58 domain-containing protein [Tissierella sp.]|uniref:DUF58 domain-containing protein n=1 Tax=Tissierella sp. TaxID=41274 RepID=UPI002861E6F6|nr:DUF58 domain-containing protein [Tissierella sp.]MDR7857409.1 DUF58 domain-containing protein [Tissierella sp.]
MIWFLVALLGITYVINMVALSYGFTNLNYRMEIRQKTAEIGDGIDIESIVENLSLLSVSFLRIDELFPTGFHKKQNTYTLFVMPYQRVKRTYKLIAEKRGLYSIKDVTLTLGDFVGLESHKKQIKLDHEVIVFPKKLELSENIVPEGALSGDISVKRWIIDDPLMTIGIREYTGNEPERYIHWPSSIKYGNLMVRSFDFTTDNSVMVVLNLETMKPCWKPVEEGLIENAISITRGVIEEFEDIKIPYGIANNEYNKNPDYVRGHFYHPGLGQSHLVNLLEVLGKINYKVPFFFENTLKDIGKSKGNYSTIVIITPRILETYIDPINELSRTVNGVVVISLEGEHLEQLNNKIIKYRSK